jgi:hypothetical protein
MTRDVVPEQLNKKMLAWVALLFSVILSAVVSVRLGQDVNWDLQNYHLYNGYAFLTKRFFYDFAPAQMQTFLNPLLHVLSYLVRGYCSPRFAAIFLGALQGINIFLIFQISQVLFQNWEYRRRTLLSAVNALAGFYAVVNIGELGTTFGDNLVSIPLLAGILLIVRLLMSDNQAHPKPALSLLMAGILAGAAVGLKLTVTFHIIALAVALPAAMLLRPVRLRPVPLLAFYGGIAGGFLVGYGRWGWQLYRAYQNPFFPFLNNIFRSPFYESRNTMDMSYIPHQWHQILLSPFLFAQKTMLAGEQMHRDMRYALCYVAIILLAGYAWYRKSCKSGTEHRAAVSGGEAPCLLLLALFIAISYLGWQYLFSIYRYLSVLEWISPVFLALTIAALVKSRKLAIMAALSVDLVICASVFTFTTDRIAYDVDYLKVEIPAIPDLDRYLILMAGPEPSSYLIPQFPPGTRFVRISSNWLSPGQSSQLDQQVRHTIGLYDPSRILLYCATKEEIKNADISLYPFQMSKSDDACRELGSPLGNKGFLCSVTDWLTPVFRPATDVQLSVALSGAKAPFGSTPVVAIAGKDTLVFQLTGLPFTAIDVFYNLDGREMPPQRHWVLDAQRMIRMPVGLSTARGLYHFTGVRNAESRDITHWIKTDASVRIR